MLVTSIFLLFLQFVFLSKKSSTISAKKKSWSINPFNLDKSTFVLYGKDLLYLLPSLLWLVKIVRCDTILQESVLASGTSFFTGGDISPNGKEVLVKDADKIYYYAPVDGDYLSALTHPGVEVPYHKERLGESVCWSADGSSYYTLGEDNHAVLYRYDRQ